MQDARRRIVNLDNKAFFQAHAFVLKDDHFFIQMQSARSKDRESEGVFLDEGVSDDKSKGSDPQPPAMAGSAFKPVPKSSPAAAASAIYWDKGDGPRPRFPSAFSSPATHFKPIVLQVLKTFMNCLYHG